MSETCGVGCRQSYAVGVARARSVEGPFEKHPSPIMHRCGYVPPTAGNVPPKPSAIEGGTGLVPGHCSVLPVQGQADRWAMFYHGRNMLKNGSRVLMMDELRWDSDGWPTIGGCCPSHTTLPVP